MGHPPRGLLRLTAPALALALAPAPAQARDAVPDAHGFIVAGPAEPVPAEGVRRELLYGDPARPGLYAMRLTFPPGTGTRPHYHSTARYIAVLKGTWWVASGPEAAVHDPDATRPVAAGTFIYQPPEGLHYDLAKDEEVVVQIMGVGPVVTTRLPAGGRP